MLDDDPTTPGDGGGGSMGPPVADFTEAFGGAISYGLGEFNVPTTAESWAGANMNTELYPIDFQKAAVSRSWVQWLMVGRLMFASALRRTLPDTEPSQY